MKVLLRIRGDVMQYPGGDYVQLLRIRDTLEELGHECAIAPGLDAMPAGVDVVHLFNTTRIHETYLQFREAKRRGLPVVLTPIWHSMREMRKFYGRQYKVPLFPIWKYMAAKELYYARRSGQPILPSATMRYRELQREVVRGVDMVAANSGAELQIMREELGVEPRAARVTAPLFEPTPIPAQARGVTGKAERVDLVCAGRIEPRKNQLSVIRAFKSLGKRDRRLVLYGSKSGAHPAYVQAVEQEMEPGWVEYRGYVAPEELSTAYHHAKGVILASYFETCGFAAMEAVANGAQVCVSDTPYTRDFFEGHAFFCDPFAIASIRAGIEQVLAAPAPMLNGFLHAFSRETVLRETREVYQCVTH
jgi:glycosyltransferase involved in cell wall biosynthesis